MDNTQQRREIIGGRIRALRHGMDLTLGELGEMLGLKGSRISNWEQGIRMAPIVELQRLARIFRVSPAYLSGHEDEIGCYDGFHHPRGSSIAISKEYLREVKATPETTICHIVRDGDCAPVIPEGAEVIINTKEKVPTDSCYMAMKVGSHTVIAHVVPDDGGYVIRGERKEPGDIKFIGRVHTVTFTV